MTWSSKKSKMTLIKIDNWQERKIRSRQIVVAVYGYTVVSKMRALHCSNCLSLHFQPLHSVLNSFSDFTFPKHHTHLFFFKNFLVYFEVATDPRINIKNISNIYLPVYSHQVPFSVHLYFDLFLFLVLF